VPRSGWTVAATIERRGGEWLGMADPRLHGESAGYRFLGSIAGLPVTTSSGRCSTTGHRSSTTRARPRGALLAQDALAKARTERQKAWKIVDDERERIEVLKQFLEQDSDTRASTALDAMSSKNWGLAALDTLLALTLFLPTTRKSPILTKAPLIETPDAERIKKAAAARRAADAQLRKIAGTDADRARKLALLLEQALKFHESHGGSDCPVCGTKKVIGRSWAKQDQPNHGAAPGPHGERHLVIRDHPHWFAVEQHRLLSDRRDRARHQDDERPRRNGCRRMHRNRHATRTVNCSRAKVSAAR
jgi:hypothetical protein